MGLPAAGIGTALAPFTGGASLALTAIGAGIGAAGAAQSSAATAANAAYQSQVAKNNQIIAEQNAGLAIQSGVARSTTRSLQNAAAVGRLKAMQSVSAGDVNTGTAVNVRASQAEMGRLDTMTTMNTAELEGYGYRVQGQNYGAQAQLDTAQAAQARAAGGIGVATSLIGGAGQLSNRFLWMAQYGGRGGGGGIGDPFGTGGLY